MNLRAILLLAVLAIAAIGCHKEPGNGGENDGGNEPSPADTTCVVTFDANGGSGEMQPLVFNMGETKALTTNTFTYEYHSFVNWNTMADGSGDAYINGQEITVVDDITLYAQWRLNNPINGYEWVDLGLPSKTKWAKCNVGAVNPENYGYYYAWGETQMQMGIIYNWSSYEFANGDEYRLTKYCNDSNYGDNGFTDAFMRLLPEDDVATDIWGEGWRMPTAEEMSELLNYCTVEWTTQNGVNGRLFIGSNGNTLFLPAAGYCYDGVRYHARNYGHYWSSSLSSDEPYKADYLNLSLGVCFVNKEVRCRGASVRPVCSLCK